MSRKLLLKRSYADIVKGADYVADEQERDDEIQIIAEEWANGEPGYVDITPAMCTYGYKKVKEEATNYSYSPIKKKPKKRTTIRTLVRKLPSFDDNWEPEVRKKTFNSPIA